MNQAAIPTAPNILDFENLMRTAISINDRALAIECSWAVLAPGRLSLRTAAAAHYLPTWHHKVHPGIRVPHRSPCVCGYCERAAERRAQDSEADKEEILEMYWQGKTENSARYWPIFYTRRTWTVVNEYTQYIKAARSAKASGPFMSPQTLRRRVKLVAQHTDGIDPGRITVRGLRAHAAQFWARVFNDIGLLTYLFGWEYPHTAIHYLYSSGVAAARRMAEEFDLEYQMPIKYTSQRAGFETVRERIAKQDDFITVENRTPDFERASIGELMKDDEDILHEQGKLDEFAKLADLSDVDDVEEKTVDPSVLTLGVDQMGRKFTNMW